MADKIIGVLGGMGPEATLDCLHKILANTQAEIDQEHLRVLVDINPQIPDRTSAVLRNGESPVPALVKSCQGLAAAGADFIIIPCVTAHFFYDQFSKQSPLPIISILDVVVQTIKKDYPDYNRIGLMSTDGTKQSGIFQKALAKEGLEIVLLDDDTQTEVMKGIYDLKSSLDPEVRVSVTRRFSRAAQTLVDNGAQAVIAGCTEIPLALSQENLSVPYFDSLTLLARAAIRAAGREPI